MYVVASHAVFVDWLRAVGARTTPSAARTRCEGVVRQATVAHRKFAVDMRVNVPHEAHERVSQNDHLHPPPTSVSNKTRGHVPVRGAGVNDHTTHLHAVQKNSRAHVDGAERLRTSSAVRVRERDMSVEPYAQWTVRGVRPASEHTWTPTAPLHVSRVKKNRFTMFCAGTGRSVAAVPMPPHPSDESRPVTPPPRKIRSVAVPLRQSAPVRPPGGSQHTLRCRCR